MSKKRDEAKMKMNALYSQPRSIPKAQSSTDNLKRANPLSLMQDALTMMSPDNHGQNQDNLIATLNPAKIFPSFVADRLTLDDDPEFENLVESIQQSGQQIPILVRPHPSKDDNYQIAFGHRRWRACQKLDIPVRAIVKALTDDDLVVAQGTENTERKNLSFIEQALFAFKLQSQNFSRETISAALGRKGKKSDQYISMLTSIPKAVPVGIIEKIGAAPKIGRPRWEQFVKSYSEAQTDSARTKAFYDLIGSEEWKNKSSDLRFSNALNCLAEVKKTAEKPSKAIKISRNAQMVRKGRNIEIRFDNDISTELENTIKKTLRNVLNDII